MITSFKSPYLLEIHTKVCVGKMIYVRISFKYFRKKKQRKVDLARRAEAGTRLGT